MNDDLVRKLRFMARAVYAAAPIHADDMKLADEAADRIEADAKRIAELEAKLAAVIEALTPSSKTKAAYHGEFSFQYTTLYVDGNYVELNINVPWTTIKEIMAAIRGV